MLKMPVRAGTDIEQPDLFDADDNLLNVAEFVEVARRANLHEEMVARLKGVRDYAAGRAGWETFVMELTDLLSRAEVKP
jgi:hypothetical protein